MEMQKHNEVVITQQPQSAPNYVVVQETQRNNHVAAIGALVFSIVTLVCCPGSLFCTIPSCICAIVALSGNDSDSEKTLSIASFVATGVYWILTVIAIIVIIILAVAGVFSQSTYNDTYDDHFDYFENYFNKDSFYG